MNLAEELQKLQQLHQSGGISDDEYARAKARLLDGSTSGAPADIEQQTRLWAMLLHLSQLANCVAPPCGLIAPILIWQIKKSELPAIDDHGKVVVNWMISGLIYGVVSFLLCFLLVGVPLLIALGIVAVVFPIIGGIKANNGELWRYPLSIEFLK